MLSVSISCTDADPIAQHRARAQIWSNSRSRCKALSFLESASPVIGLRGSRITAAATTGPASGPRPASSTPAIRPGRVPAQLPCSGLQYFFDRIGRRWEVSRCSCRCRAAKRSCSAATRSGSSSQAPQRCGQRLGCRLLLQQLGHDEIPAQDVGQPHPGLQPLAPHDLPGQPVHVVGNHHRPLEQGRLQRGGAAGDQRHVAGGQRGVRLARQDANPACQSRPRARACSSAACNAGTAGMMH